MNVQCSGVVFVWEINECSKLIIKSCQQVTSSPHFLALIATRHIETEDKLFEMLSWF